MPKWLKEDPLGTERNPFQVYLLCLCILSGFTTVGPDTQSTTGSVDYYLDYPHETIWSLMLIVGAFLALLGMYWHGDIRNALIMKRLAFTSLCIPIFVYGLVILLVAGVAGLTLTLTIWGFSVASAIQAWRANKRIKLLIPGGSHGE